MSQEVMGQPAAAPAALDTAVHGIDRLRSVHARLSLWGRGTAQSPSRRVIHTGIEENIAQRPHAVAVEHEGAITYAQFDAVSAVVESALGCVRATTLKASDTELPSFVIPATVDADAAHRLVAQGLPYYYVPSRVIALDDLQITPRGNIDKRAAAAGHRTRGEAGMTRQIENSMALSAGGVETWQPSPARAEPSAWRRFWSHPMATQYHRLFALLALANAVGLALGLARWGWARDAQQVPLATLGHLALANFTLAILIRQQRVVNALFWLASRVPKSAPLWLRWQCAKVFHFGGLHTAGASAGTLWFALLLVAQAWHLAAGGGNVSGRTLGLGGLALALLTAIILTALPSQRASRHDRFELMHRYGGWSLLLVFWLHAASTQADASPAQGLAGTPVFWVLCVLTLSVASPWWRLRRVPVQAVRPSSHAVILRFDGRVKKTPFAGSSTSLSLSPLGEWHSFANVPTPGEDGFRLVVSRAGDWTGALIDSPPKHLWIKGITTGGAAFADCFFKRVVYVATGSGIGPIMPHLLFARLPVHLIWATRSPVQTYGQPLVDEILAVVPDAQVWDTDARGKPDLAALALDAVAAFKAEAVIVIANRKLTETVIRAVELRGIPGYGAIWDS